MYVEIDDDDIYYNGSSSERKRWDYFLSFLTGVPFFLHGYFPVLLLLLLEGGSAKSTSTTDKLLRNLQRKGIYLWPYCIGVMGGLGASSVILDRYGRKTCMQASAWLLSLVLFVLGFAPNAFLTNGGETGKLSQHQGNYDRQFIIQELKYSFYQISYAELIAFAVLGGLLTVFVQAALLFVVESSKPSLRGFHAAACTRQILYGVVVACIAVSFFPPVPTDTNLASDSYALEFRWYYAFPLVLVVAVGTGLSFPPDTPYWLMAQRTPAECMAALRVIRHTSEVGPEYEAIYHGASDEARLDSRWRSLVAEYPFRYVINLGVIIQTMFVLGGIQLIALQGNIFLQLCGLYELSHPIFFKGCTTTHEVLDETTGTSRLLGGVPLPISVPSREDELSDGFDDFIDSYISIGGFGCCIGIIACLLGSYAASTHLYNRGGRRVQLIANMVAISVCLLVLSYVLSGDGGTKLLNFNTSVGLQKYLNGSSGVHSSNLHGDQTNSSDVFYAQPVERSNHKHEVEMPQTDSPTLMPTLKHDTPVNAQNSNILPALPSIYFDYQFDDSVKTARVVVCLCVVGILFFFWASVGVLSWLQVAESFPMRVRAKGTAIVFGISAVINTMSYVFIHQPAYIPMVNALNIIYSDQAAAHPHLALWSLNNNTGYAHKFPQNGTPSTGGGAGHGLSELVCFEQWVRDGYLEIHIILLIFAIATVSFAVYFFLALPETDGKILTEMDELFDVNDFDLCMGCYPHGQASGFLGIRMGHGLTRDFVPHTSEIELNSSMSMSLRPYPPPRDIDSSFSSGKITFIPGSAFDPGYWDIDMAQISASNLTLKERLRLGWSRVKNFTSGPLNSPERTDSFHRSEVYENSPSKKGRKTPPSSYDLSGDLLLWDESSRRGSRSSLIDYGTTIEGSRSENRRGARTPSPLTLPGGYEHTSAASMKSSKRGHAQQAVAGGGNRGVRKYNLSVAAFQFDEDDEDRDEDAFYF